MKKAILASAAVLSTLVAVAVPSPPAHGAEEPLLSVRFERRETTLAASSRNQLIKKLPLLRSRPGSLVVGGCALDKGAAPLHEARCRVVREFLIENGISPKKVKISSYCGLRRKPQTGDGEVITIAGE